MASDLKMTMASRDEPAAEAAEVAERLRAEAAEVAERLLAAERLERESHERDVLAEIGRVISSSPRVDEAYGELAQLARTLVPYDSVTVARWDRQENVLVEEYSTGAEVPGASPCTVVSLGRLDIEELYPVRKARIFDRDAFALIAGQSGIPVETMATPLGSAMSVPLVSRDEIIGNLTFRSARPDAYGKEDLVLADQIAGQIAGAVANSQLVDMLTESLRRLSGEVAERTRAEEGLRELTEELEDRVSLRTVELETERLLTGAIIATIREPLVVLDAELRVVSANRSFYETFSVSEEETEGVLIYELGNRQWDIPGLRELLEQILPENTLFEDYGIEHDFPAIGQRVMQLNARRLYREANETQMILLAIEDITEHQRAEEALARRSAELEAANTDLEAFAYSVSHDLRAPLRAIEGFSHILEREHASDLSEEPQRYLRLVGENVRDMVSLIDDMLALSRGHVRQRGVLGPSRHPA